MVTDGNYMILYMKGHSIILPTTTSSSMIDPTMLRIILN